MSKLKLKSQPRRTKRRSPWRNKSRHHPRVQGIHQADLETQETQQVAVTPLAVARVTQAVLEVAVAPLEVVQVDQEVLEMAAAPPEAGLLVVVPADLGIQEEVEDPQEELGIQEEVKDPQEETLMMRPTSHLTPMGN